MLARSEAGIELLLVDPNAPGVKLTHYLSASGEPHFRVDFANARVPKSARIGGAGAGWEVFSGVLTDDGLIPLAAFAIGGAAACLEDTVEYAKVRKQFDKPLGAFQALAHYMADASTRIRGLTIILGGKTIASAEVFSNEPIQYVIFCIDGYFMFWDTQPPYEWTIQGWFFPIIGKHILEVYAHTASGKIASDEMDVFMLSYATSYKYRV